MNRREEVTCSSSDPSCQILEAVNTLTNLVPVIEDSSLVPALKIVIGKLRNMTSGSQGNAGQEATIVHNLGPDGLDRLDFMVTIAFLSSRLPFEAAESPYWSTLLGCLDENYIPKNGATYREVVLPELNLRLRNQLSEMFHSIAKKQFQLSFSATRIKLPSEKTQLVIWHHFRTDWIIRRSHIFGVITLSRNMAEETLSAKIDNLIIQEYPHFLDHQVPVNLTLDTDDELLMGAFENCLLQPTIFTCFKSKISNILNRAISLSLETRLVFEYCVRFVYELDGDEELKASLEEFCYEHHVPTVVRRKTPDIKVLGKLQAFVDVFSALPAIVDLQEELVNQERPNPVLTYLLAVRQCGIARLLLSPFKKVCQYLECLQGGLTELDFGFRLHDELYDELVDAYVHIEHDSEDDPPVDDTPEGIVKRCLFAISSQIIPSRDQPQYIKDVLLVCQFLSEKNPALIDVVLPILRSTFAGHECGEKCTVVQEQTPDGPACRIEQACQKEMERFTNSESEITPLSPDEFPILCKVACEFYSVPSATTRQESSIINSSVPPVATTDAFEEQATLILHAVMHDFVNI